MNVFEQSVWRQFIAEVNKHDQEERIKRDAIIRQRGLTALPNGMLAVAADIEMSPSKRLGLEQKTIPEALAQWLGVFQRRQSAEPNEYGELFERVPLSEVVYGENRHYVFRARIPEYACAALWVPISPMCKCAYVHAKQPLTSYCAALYLNPQLTSLFTLVS